MSILPSKQGSGGFGLRCSSESGVAKNQGVRSWTFSVDAVRRMSMSGRADGESAALAFASKRGGERQNAVAMTGGGVIVKIRAIECWYFTSPCGVFLGSELASGEIWPH